MARTIKELLRWAKSKNLHIEIKGDGWTRVETEIGISRYFRCIACESTARKALLEARRVKAKAGKD
jgi:hypothetical protein